MTPRLRSSISCQTFVPVYRRCFCRYQCPWNCAQWTFEPPFLVLGSSFFLSAWSIESVYCATFNGLLTLWPPSPPLPPHEGRSEGVGDAYRERTMYLDNRASFIYPRTLTGLPIPTVALSNCRYPQCIEIAVCHGVLYPPRGHVALRCGMPAFPQLLSSSTLGPDRCGILQEKGFAPSWFPALGLLPLLCTHPFKGDPPKIRSRAHPRFAICLFRCFRIAEFFLEEANHRNERRKKSSTMFLYKATDVILSALTYWLRQRADKILWEQKTAMRENT